MKYLLVIITVLLVGCENNNTQKGETILWEFHPKNHHDQWDLKVFHLINEYQAIQKNYSVYDSVEFKKTLEQLINSTDTLLSHSIATDSITQNIWVSGLQIFKNELEALVLEREPAEKQTQFNMCTISFIHLLADIGYTKTNIYIFQKPNEDDAYFWFGSDKSSKNPFDPSDRKEYEASLTLQEPK